MAIQAINVSRQQIGTDPLNHGLSWLVEKVRDIWATLCAKCSFSMHWEAKYPLDSNRFSPIMVRLQLRDRLDCLPDSIEERHSECRIESSFTKTIVDQTLPETDKKYIAIPVVIKGSVEDHIVCFFIDQKTHTVEFFDSKGRTVKDLETETVRGTSQKSLGELADDILAKYTAIAFNQHTQKAQHDCHSCGLFVWDFIQRRLDGKTLDQIQAEPLMADDVTRKRFFDQLDQPTSIVKVTEQKEAGDDGMGDFENVDKT